MPQILSIQYLRAIAAMLVVALHASIVIRRDYAHDFPMFTTGEFGVDLFFVISGFIMWTIASSRETSPGAFFERRIVRIVPLYWALTIPTALISMDGGFHVDPSADFGSLVRSFFFIPEWNEKLGMVTPVLFVGWTLNLEMFFYAVFALALFLKPEIRLFAIVALLTALAASRLAIGVSGHPAINLYSRSLVGEFAFGVLLGWFFQNGFSKFADSKGAWRYGVLLIAAGAAATPFRDQLTEARLLHFGVPALMIVAGALLAEKRLARLPLPPLKFLGDASYSIYLAHIMAQSASLKIFGPLLGAGSPLLAVLGMTACGCAAGASVHLLVERPLTRFAGAVARRLRSFRPDSLAAAAPLPQK